MGTYKLKMLLLGGGGINTSNYIKPYIKGSFQKDYKMTIGCDIYTKDVRLNDGQDLVTLSIWEIASQDRFRFFRSSFYRGSAGAIIFIDLTRYYTLNPNLVNLIREIWSHTGRIPLVVFGCKADLVNMRNVRRSDIDAFVQQVPCPYFETRDALEEVFNYLAAEMLQNIQVRGPIPVNRNLNLGPQHPAPLTPQVDFYGESKRILREILKEFGFKIKGNSVEILNEHGFFTVDIESGKTYFESIHCSDCEYQKNCKEKKKKSLCIVGKCDGGGWSNLDLSDSDLLIFSKIYAISENQIPNDVLDQMMEASCRKDS